MNLDRFEQLLTRLPVKDRETNQSVPFKLNPNQSLALHKIRQQYEAEKLVRIICCKSRRVGMSSLIDALLFTHCLSRHQAHAEIIAQLKDTSEKGLFRVPRDLAVAMNHAAEGTCDVYKRHIEFIHSKGNSLLDIATAGTVVGGRGLTLTALHLSEAAMYPGSDSFLSVLPAVSKGQDTIIAIESTPFGRTGLGQVFYEFWGRANQTGRTWNGYVPIFLSWLDDPACNRPEDEADDAPANDLERELMKKPWHATRSQIAWMRRTLESECEGQENKFCIAYDQMVSTHEHGIVAIEAVTAGELTESGVIRDHFSNGIHECVKIETHQGYSLVCTPDHQLLTVRNGFEPAEDTLHSRIRLGIPVFGTSLVRVEIPDANPVEIDESYARWLGYFMGDGCFMNPKGGGFYVEVCGDNQDNDVRAQMQRDQEYVIGRPMKSQRHKSANSWAIRNGSVYFRTVANVLGIINSQRPLRRVCVPNVIMQSPKRVVREFLRGVFEADGSSSNNQVRLFSNSDELKRGCQLLLLGFGITSTRRGKWLILQGEEATAYCDEIGFIGTRKNTLIPKFKRTYSRTGAGVNMRSITLCDRVVSITPAGPREVYDLTIEPSHQFVANGITVHNCQEYGWCAEVAFVATGDPAFPKREINYALSTKKPPLWRGSVTRQGDSRKFFPDRMADLQIWEWPKPGCHYYIGGDAAAGYETGDFACLCGFNGTTGDQAFVITAHIHPEELAEQADLLGRHYNNAMVNIELTGNLGRWAQKKLRDQYMYPNLYVWRGKDDKKLDAKGASRALGWETTNATRGLMFDAFREGLRAGLKDIPGGIRIFDAELVRQMDVATFREGLKWEVVKGHDDVLCAAMLAVVARAQYPPPSILNYRVNVLEKNEKIRLGVLKPQEQLQLALKKDLKMIMNQRPLKRGLTGAF